MKTRVGLTVLLALTFLAGCGGSDDPSATSTPTSTASATNASDKSTVKVLDAGAEPREPIRLRFQEGDVQRTSLRMLTTTEMTMDGKSAPAFNAPPMVMGMRVKVEEVRPDGVIESSFGYDSVKVEGSGKTAEQLKEMLTDNLLGVTGQLETTANGEFVDGDMDIPSGTDANMRAMLKSIESQMSSMVVPLPTEDVGIGAVWTVATETEINGIESNNVYRFKLIGRSADRLVLETTTTGSAPEQDPDLPGMPSGSTVHLDRMVLSGSGRTEMDLTRLLPVSSTASMRTDVKMTITENGSTGVILQKMKMQVEVGTR